MIKSIKIIVVLFYFSHQIIIAQSGDKLTDGVIYLSNYLTSQEVEILKSKKNDLELLDSLYSKSIIFFDYDYSEALLALTFTTLPFNSMPLKTPFFNLQLDLPLPSPEDSLFILKNKNLPTFYFWDSKSLDIDKTTHFFGNAFLTNSIPIYSISEYLGKMVELFENSFKINGNLDERDLLVNKMGAIFGKLLHENKNLKPSQIIIVYNITVNYNNPL